MLLTEVVWFGFVSGACWLEGRVLGCDLTASHPSQSAAKDGAPAVGLRLRRLACFVARMYAYIYTYNIGSTKCFTRNIVRTIRFPLADEYVRNYLVSNGLRVSWRCGLSGPSRGAGRLCSGCRASEQSRWCCTRWLWNRGSRLA